MRNIASFFFRSVYDRSCGVGLCAGSGFSGLRVHEQGDDESVKTQDFGENENENHSDEQPGLLSGSSDTSIADNSDGKSSSHTRETDGETGTELNEAREEGGFLFQAVGDEHGNDETVNTDDTSHDDGNDVWVR
jgi:hypothetical protein